MRINRIERTKFNIVAGTINRVLILFMGFIVRTILIKQLGTEYLGLSSLMTSILNILNLAEVGFGSAVVYNLYKPIAEDNVELICALLKFYRKAYIIIGMSILGVGLVLLPFLPSFIKGNIPQGINIYLVYVVFLLNTCIGYCLFAYLNVLLNAHQRNDIDSYLSLLTYVLQYSLQIGVLFLVKSYYLYILVLPLVTTCTNIIRYIIIRKIYPNYVCRGKLDEATKKSVFENVKGLLIQKICAATRNTFDSIFISSFIGLVATGIYDNYYYIISSVHGFLVILASAMSAGVGNSIAIETQEKNHNDMRKFTFIYAWLSGWCTICILCNYQVFMKIWVGSDMILPMYDVVLFCMYFYFLTIGDIRGLYSCGAGLWWKERYKSILEIVFNLVLNFILGKRFGIPGIIMATIITIVFINFIYGTRIVYKFYFTRFSEKQYYLQHLYYLFVTVLSAIPCYCICNLILLTGVAKLLVNAVICVLVPNVCYYIIYRKNIIFRQSFEFLFNSLRK